MTIINCDWVPWVASVLLWQSKKLRDFVSKKGAEISDVDALLQTATKETRNRLSIRKKALQSDIDKVLWGSLLKPWDRVKYKQTILKKIKDKDTLKETFDLLEAMDSGTPQFNELWGEYGWALKALWLKNKREYSWIVKAIGDAYTNKLASDIVEYDIHNIDSFLSKNWFEDIKALRASVKKWDEKTLQAIKDELWIPKDYFKEITGSVLEENYGKAVNNFLIANAMFDPKYGINSYLKVTDIEKYLYPDIIDESIINNTKSLLELKDLVFSNLSWLTDDIAEAVIKKRNELASGYDWDIAEYVSVFDSVKQYVSDPKEFWSRANVASMNIKGRKYWYSFSPTKKEIEKSIKADNPDMALDKNKYKLQELVDAQFDWYQRQRNYGMSLYKKLTSFLEALVVKPDSVAEIGMTRLTIDDLPNLIDVVWFEKISDSVDVPALISTYSLWDPMRAETMKDILAKLEFSKAIEWDISDIVAEWTKTFSKSSEVNPTEILISTLTGTPINRDKSFFWNSDIITKEKFSEESMLPWEVIDAVRENNSVKIGQLAWEVIDEDLILTRYAAWELETLVVKNSLERDKLRRLWILDKANEISKNSIESESPLAPLEIVYPKGKLVYNFFMKEWELFVWAQDNIAKLEVEDTFNALWFDIINWEYGGNVDELYENFLKQRYGENYEEAQKVLKDEYSWMTQSEINKSMGLMTEVDRNYIQEVRDLDDLYEKLPDDVDFYKRQAERIAREEGHTLPDGDVLLTNSPKEIKEAYFSMKYFEDIETHISAKQDFLATLGIGYGSWTRDLENLLYHDVIMGVADEGFVMPLTPSRSFLDSVKGWLDQPVDSNFIRDFIARNSDSPSWQSLEGATWPEKVLNLFRQKFTTARKMVWVDNYTTRLKWTRLVTEYIENPYIKFKNLDVTRKMIRNAEWNPINPLTGVEKVQLEQLLDKYEKDIIKMVKQWATEWDIQLAKRKAQIAVFEIEMELVRKYWELFKNPKSLYTQKYNLFKISNTDDVAQFKESIQQVKDGFNKTLSDINKAAKKSKEPSITMTEDWYVSVFNEWRYISKDIDTVLDEALEKMPDDSGVLWALKYVDKSWLSNTEKFDMYKIARVADLAMQKSISPQQKLYAAINPEYATFFSDYRLINIDSVWELPTILSKRNHTIGWAKELSSYEDLVMKSRILTDISPLVTRWALNDKSLTRVVEKALIDMNDDIDPFLLALYKELYNPYIGIKKVSQENQKLFKELTIDKQIDEFSIDDALKWRLSQINIDTPNGTVNLWWFVNGTVEETLPQVIKTKWRQTFWKNITLPEEELERIAKEERVKIENWRDDIDELNELDKELAVSVFQQALPVLKRSARTRKLASVILTMEEKWNVAWHVLSLIDSNWNEVLSFVTWFSTKKGFKKKLMEKPQEVYKEYMSLNDAAFAKITRTSLSWEADMIAYHMADYFRWITKRLEGISLDDNLNKAFSKLWDSFTKVKSYNDFLRLQSAIEKWNIFQLLDYNFITWVNDIDSSFNLFRWTQKINVSKIDDEAALTKFNEAFASEFNMSEFNTIMTSVWGIRLWWAVNMIKDSMNRLISFFTPWLVRFLYSYPFSLLSAPYQSYGYKTKISSVMSRYGFDIHKYDTELRDELWILVTQWAELWQGLSREILWYANALSSREWISDLEYVNNFQAMIKDPKAYLEAVGISVSSGQLRRLADQTKENANNLVDAWFNPQVKDMSFNQALREKGYLGSESFKQALDNASTPAIRQKLIDEVNVKSLEIYNDFMGISNNSLYQLQYNWTLPAMFGTALKLINFRGWWGMMTVRNIARNFAQGWKMTWYLVKNGFSNEAIDNAVRWTKDNPDWRNMVYAIFWDLYWTTRLARLQNTWEYDETWEGADVTFWDWYQTLQNLSQNMQAFQSAGIGRPLISAFENIAAEQGLVEWVPWWTWADPYGIAGFMNTLGSNIVREAKILGTVARIWQAIGNSTEEWDWQDVLSEELVKLSSWALRYMLSDVDYQKAVTADTTDVTGLDWAISWTSNNSEMDYAFSRFDALTWQKILDDDIGVWEIMKDIFSRSKLWWWFEDTYDLLFANEQRWRKNWDVTELMRRIEETDYGMQFINSWWLFFPETQADYDSIEDNYTFNQKGWEVTPWFWWFYKALQQYKDTGFVWYVDSKTKKSETPELQNMVEFLDEKGLIDKMIEDSTSLTNVDWRLKRRRYELITLNNVLEETPMSERPVGWEKVMAAWNLSLAKYQKKEQLKAATKKATKSSSLTPAQEQSIWRDVVDEHLAYTQMSDKVGQLDLLAKKIARQDPEIFENYLSYKEEGWERVLDDRGQPIAYINWTYKNQLRRYALVKKAIDEGDIDAYENIFRPLVNQFDWTDDEWVRTVNLMNQTLAYIKHNDNIDFEDKVDLKVNLITMNPTLLDEAANMLKLSPEWDLAYSKAYTNFYDANKELTEAIEEDALGLKDEWKNGWWARPLSIKLNIPPAKIKTMQEIANRNRGKMEPMVIKPFKSDVRSIYWTNRNPSKNASSKNPYRVNDAKSKLIAGIEWQVWQWETKTARDIDRNKRGAKKKFTYKEPKNG